MNKIKRWIVGKLGGIMIDEIPVDILQELYNYLMNKTIDKITSDTFPPIKNNK